MSRNNDKQHPEYRYGVEMANNQRRLGPAKPAGANDMDMAQREQAMRFLQGIMKVNQEPEYTPVLKSLKMIGITPRNMTVMVGDEPTDCLVIPVAELMSKEWAHMSGQDENKEQENA